MEVRWREEVEVRWREEEYTTTTPRHAPQPPPQRKVVWKKHNDHRVEQSTDVRGNALMGRVWKE